jgi:pimeloyl-ACP methyl ester carboxylesterase
MRAREPDREGFVDRDGVKLHYEVFGDGEPTLMLVPSNPIVHSRQWKAQVPYLARHYRVVTFDGRGNGRSDRPVTPEAHTEEACVADLEAVLAATCPESAVLIGLCGDGVWRSLWFAADHLSGWRASSRSRWAFPSSPHPTRTRTGPRSTRCSTATKAGPSSTVTTGGATTPASSSSSSPRCSPSRTPPRRSRTASAGPWRPAPEVMLASMDAPFELSKQEVEEICRRVQSPLLIVHGVEDRCQPYARAERLAELTGAPLVTMAGAGHMLPARHPVKINLLIKDFVDHLSTPGQRTRTTTTPVATP